MDSNADQRPASCLPGLSGASCTPLYHVSNRLGEGAFWDQHGQRLIWVDILEAKVFVGASEGYATFSLPVMPSAIWKVSGERVYLATEEGVGELTLSNGRYRTCVYVEADRPDTRSNDGAMAPDGSFWFGTTLNEPGSKGGSLYCVSPDFSVRRIYAPVGIPNTFLFPDGMNNALIGDSLDACIYRYELSKGRVRGRECWMKKHNACTGVPDGSALVHGKAVINAEWDGGRLVGYDMQGHAYDAIDLPVSRPTSCVLGGSEGQVLYVTSARDGLTAGQLADEPLAGSIFAVNIRLPDNGEQ